MNPYLHRAISYGLGAIWMGAVGVLAAIDPIEGEWAHNILYMIVLLVSGAMAWRGLADDQKATRRWIEAHEKVSAESAKQLAELVRLNAGMYELLKGLKSRVERLENQLDDRRRRS